MQKLVHLMKSYGETLTDKMIVEKVMCMLTSHFDHVIVAIQESNNLDTLKLEDLVGSLEAREIRIVERKGVQDSIQTLHAQSWNENGVFPTISKEKSTRLSPRSLGRILKRIKSMIELLNPPKEEKQVPIKKTKKGKKGCLRVI